MNQKRIFIIEDEPDIRNLLEFILTSEGYTVSHFANGEDAIKEINIKTPDLILLDVMLPGINGLEICKLIKNNQEIKHIYTIILTSKADEFDILNGIYCGCDDYITKPFSQKILLAKIKAVFKKIEDKTARNLIKFKNLEIHPDKFKVIISGKQINFTPSEFKLLHFLAKNNGQVYNREKLYEVIHEYDDNAVDRSVDILIAKIRKKLGDYSKYIESIYGVGYKFIEITD